MKFTIALILIISLEIISCTETESLNLITRRRVHNRSLNHKNILRKSKEPKNLPNSEWMVLGYNLYKGNPFVIPKGKNYDEGFSLSIFKLDFTQPISDNVYNMPKGFDIQPTQACNSAMSSKSIKSSNSLKNEMLASLGIYISSANGAYFGGNVEHKIMTDTLNKADTEIISNIASCVVYRSVYEDTNPPDFSDSFKNQINGLFGKTFIDNKTLFFDFIDKFGTHYVKQSLMGSKYIYLSEVSSSEAKKLRSQGKNIEMEVGYKASTPQASITFAASVGVGESREISEEINNLIRNTKVTTIGSSLSSLEIDDWIKSSKKGPMPITYKLDSIINLLHQDEIKKKLNKDGYYNLVEELSTAYDNYCSYLIDQKLISDCNKSMPASRLDKVTTQSTKMSISSMENVDISCEEGQAVNSFYFNKIDDSRFVYQYKCSVSGNIFNDCEEKQSSLEDTTMEGMKKIDIKCNTGSVINSWKYKVQDGTTLYAVYKCCAAKLEDDNCATMEKKGGRAFSELGHVKVEANDNADKIVLNSIDYDNIDNEHIYRVKHCNLSEN